MSFHSYLVETSCSLSLAHSSKDHVYLISVHDLFNDIFMIYDIGKKIFFGVCFLRHFLRLNLIATYTFQMQKDLSVVNVLFSLGHSQVLQ